MFMKQIRFEYHESVDMDWMALIMTNIPNPIMTMMQNQSRNKAFLE